jgi:hypothetical protein
MSDPQRRPDDHPRRAKPLQPDKPGSGRASESDADGASRREPPRKAKVLAPTEN